MFVFPHEASLLHELLALRLVHDGAGCRPHRLDGDGHRALAEEETALEDVAERASAELLLEENLRARQMPLGSVHGVDEVECARAVVHCAARRPTLGLL